MSSEEAEGEGEHEPDDPSSGPPPNPLDRPWVHPSELSSFVAAPDAPARETRPRELAVGLASAVAAVIATVLVLVAFGALGGRHRSPLPPPVVTSPGDVVDYSVAERVGAVVAPSVVTVRVGGDATKPVGSGVVLKSDRVITASHLLNGATKVEVSTISGDVLAARVVGTDPQTDLALLAVSGDDLQLATLGSSSPPRDRPDRRGRHPQGRHPLHGRHQRRLRPRRHGRHGHRHRRRRVCSKPASRCPPTWRAARWSTPTAASSAS